MPTEALDALEFDATTGKRATHEHFDLLPRAGFVLVRNASYGDDADDHEYTVGVGPDGVPTDCTCPDYQYRRAASGEACKHQVAVALAEAVADAAAHK